MLTTGGSPTRRDPWADGAEMLTTGGSPICFFCGIPGHNQWCSRYVMEQHDPKQSRARQSKAAMWLGNKSEVRFDTGAFACSKLGYRGETKSEGVAEPCKLFTCKQRKSSRKHTNFL